MKVQTCIITLPNRTQGIAAIKKPETVTITTSFKEFAQTAEITLPRNVSVFDNKNVREVFPHGERIIIRVGYDGNFTHTFTGYITQVSADYPIVIKCQDEMWNLRKIKVNYSAKSTTLEALLKAIVGDTEVDALEGVTLTNIRLKQTTVGAVLEKLQSDYGLYSYMEGDTLVCGKYYSDNTNDPVETLYIDKAIRDNSLEYRNGDDIVLKIKGSCTSTQGQKIEYEVGEDGGDELSLPYPKANTKEELKRMVDVDYERRKLGGYEGNLTAFLLPFIKPGRKVKLDSSLFPERNGVYYVDSVEIFFTPEGAGQTLEIGGQTQ